jgi:hypothetical protein
MEPVIETTVEHVRTTMRRHVFFIAGFDPRGVTGYYQRICESLAPSATVGSLLRCGPHATQWQWQSRTDEGETTTTFEFLHWDDIVDRHWRAKGRIQAQVAAVRTLWVYWRCGLLARARDGARAVRLAVLMLGLAPLVFALSTVLVTLAGGALGAWLFPWGGWLAAPAWLAALYFWDRAWRELNLEWLARGFACIIETARGEAASWDERCAHFAARMALVEQSDEIVLVGHSLGAILAMTTLRRYLDLRPGLRPVTFATLGNIVPFYTWIEPGRLALREGAEVARSALVDWIDVTSGSDPASACRLGPLVGADVSVPRWDPEFHRILTPERFRYIRRRPLDFHFQYLKSADRADAFDLIRMMSSAKPFFAGAPR